MLFNSIGYSTVQYSRKGEKRIKEQIKHNVFTIELIEMVLYTLSYSVYYRTDSIGYSAVQYSTTQLEGRENAVHLMLITPTPLYSAVQYSRTQ